LWDTGAALAEAAAPYGIESFDSVLKPLWKGIRSHRFDIPEKVWRVFAELSHFFRTLCAKQICPRKYAPNIKV